MGDRADKVDSTPGRLTELRIHGVGGATPESLLGVPSTELVAGDKLAGFYRPPSWIPIEGPDRDLEGYSWGGITSRARLRALWVLLLPFAFVNLAGWMFPHGGSASDRERRDRPKHESIDVGLIRILALFTTSVVATFISFVVIDIIGRRCAGICLDRWYLAPWRWWANTIPSRIGLGIAAAGLIMLAIAFVARRSQANLRPTQTDDPLDPAFRIGLTDDKIWDSAHVAHRLGLVHTALALAVVGGLGAQLATGATDSGLVKPLMLIQIAVAIGCLIGVARLGFVDRYWAGLLFSVAAFAWALTIIATWTSDRADPANASMETGLGVVFGGAVLGLAALWLAGLWSIWVQRLAKTRELGSDQETDGEASMPVRIAVPALGLGLAVAFGSGVLFRVAILIDVTFDETLAGRVAVLSLGWVAAALLVAAWSLTRSAGSTPECLKARYPDSAFDASDDAWLKSVGRAEKVARVTDHAATIIIMSTITVLVVTLVGAFRSFAWIDPAAETASWVLSFAPIVSVLLMQRLYSSVDARKTFGIIWDVSSFWPRWFHPWAPPSYGERAVPRLRRRLESLTEEGDVILSAHSQGGVITAAALAPGSVDHRRIVWLTHGCPLDRLYARYFPEYFDAGLFDTFTESIGPEGDLPVWRNLWRHTDYIGGPVGGDSHELPDPSLDCAPPTEPSGSRFEEVWVPDPESPEPVLRGDPRPKPLRHSDFFSTTAYRTAIADLAETLGH